MTYNITKKQGNSEEKEIVICEQTIQARQRERTKDLREVWGKSGDLGKKEPTEKFRN